MASLVALLFGRSPGMVTAGVRRLPWRGAAAISGGVAPCPAAPTRGCHPWALQTTAAPRAATRQTLCAHAPGGAGRYGGEPLRVALGGRSHHPGTQKWLTSGAEAGDERHRPRQALGCATRVCLAAVGAALWPREKRVASGESVALQATLYGRPGL